MEISQYAPIHCSFFKLLQSERNTSKIVNQFSLATAHLKNAPIPWYILIWRSYWFKIMANFPQVTCNSFPVASTTKARSRIVRQCSQYEGSVMYCGLKCTHKDVPLHSLKQAKDHTGNAEALDATVETVRRNGTLHNFRQVWLF